MDLNTVPGTESSTTMSRNLVGRFSEHTGLVFSRLPDIFLPFQKVAPRQKAHVDEEWRMEINKGDQ